MTQEDDDTDLDDFNEDDIFPEDEVFDEDFDDSDEESSPRSGSMDKIKSVAIPVIVGGLVLGFASWKIFEVFFPPTAPAQVQQNTKFGASKLAAAKKADPVKDLVTNNKSTKKPDADNAVKQPKKLELAIEIPSQTEKAPVETGANKDRSQSATDVKVSPKATRETFDVLTHDIFGPETNESTQQAASPEIDEALKRVEEKAKENNQKIVVLSKNIKDMSQHFKTVSDNVNQVGLQLHNLGNMLAQMNRDMQYLKKEQSKLNAERTVQMQKKTSHRRAQLKRLSSEYRVDAVIPGRAWLKDRDGNVITVSEGDELNRLGTVIAIDAEKGAIITASGITIR